MKDGPLEDSTSSNRWAMLGSIGAALGAAICCLGPLVLVTVGVSGAWIGELSALEPYRPVFMFVAAGSLGWGFYHTYWRDEPRRCDDECDIPDATRINRLSLWAAAVVVIGLFASPYLLDDVSHADASTAVNQQTTADAARPSQNAGLTTVTLEVSGMTCSGCARTVGSALERMDGVDGARVTFEPPVARVTYDPTEVDVDRLTKQTASVGYPSKPVKRRRTP